MTFQETLRKLVALKGSCEDGELRDLIDDILQIYWGDEGEGEAPVCQHTWGSDEVCNHCGEDQ